MPDKTMNHFQISTLSGTQNTLKYLLGIGDTMIEKCINMGCDPTRVYVCPVCGAQYVVCDEHQIECDCPNALRDILGGISDEERAWIRQAFLETEKPITIQDPTNIYAYPLNRGRVEGSIFYFWGRAYDFRTKTISGILPVSRGVVAFARMSASEEARGMFSPHEMKEICKT